MKGQKRKRTIVSSCQDCDAEDNMDMVLCDNCNKWSHFHCAGVGPEVEHEEWSCHRCKVPSASDLTKVRIDMSNLQNTVNELTVDNKRAKSLISDLKETVVKLTNESDESKNEVRELKETALNAQEQTNSGVRMDVSNLHKTVNELTDENKRAKNDINDLKETVDKLKHDYEAKSVVGDSNENVDSNVASNAQEYTNLGESILLHNISRMLPCMSLDELNELLNRVTSDTSFIQLVKVVFLYWLPCILRMKRPGRSYSMEYPPTPCSDNSERKQHILTDVELKERSSKSLLANVLDIDDDFRHNCRPLTPGGTLPPNPAYFRTVFGPGDDGNRIPDAIAPHACIKSSADYELSLILKEIRYITDQLRKDDEDSDVARDWKFAAMVVDRLCLIIFTLFTIIATIAVLFSAPHIIVS